MEQRQPDQLIIHERTEQPVQLFDNIYGFWTVISLTT